MIAEDQHLTAKKQIHRPGKNKIQDKINFPTRSSNRNTFDIIWILIAIFFLNWSYKSYYVYSFLEYCLIRKSLWHVKVWTKKARKKTTVYTNNMLLILWQAESPHTVKNLYLPVDSWDTDDICYTCTMREHLECGRKMGCSPKSKTFPRDLKYWNTWQLAEFKIWQNSTGLLIQDVQY